MSQITPFVKRMRAQGGTLYTFSSAMEDIGLNINERNTVVKMSHFAMLDIPEITAPDNLQQNRFNLLGIDGALQQYDESGSIKDGRVLVAESFQNYALNLETILLSQDNYNPALQRTVSERVFWKWMKETGAIRWTPDVSNAGYFIEEIDTDSSTGYNSVVKYVGEISAGSVRTDTFGTYNETYVLVPTSHGQTRVYFKQDYDDNYQSGMELGTPGETTGGPDTILGRADYTKPHPDALSYQAFYDVIDSSITTGLWTMEVDASDGSGYQDGWWYSAQGKTFTDDNYYVTDVSSIISTGIYNYKLKYTGADTIEFLRSNIDAVEVELDIDNLRTVFGDSTLTFDQMAIEDSVDDQFDFNAILLYYTIWNQTLDKALATNLLGILFLDRATGNTTGFPDMEIEIPEITKLQSIGTGFGTAYSFRVNIKSDNMIDDTQAVIYDESTSSQTALESWTDVFASLEKSLSILNANSQTLQFVTTQYIDISSTQNQQANLLADLQYQVNDVIGDVTGTNNTIAMFQDGDDPLIDSSIYMEDGMIGIFNPDPSYALHVDASLSKFMDIMIENAIKDTSGNIILGYGSPLQIGSSTNYRQVDIYTGDPSPAMSFDEAGNVNMPGNLVVTGEITTINGTINYPSYIKEASLWMYEDGGKFIWTADGSLDVSVASSGGGGGTGDVAWDSGVLGTEDNFVYAIGDGSIATSSLLSRAVDQININSDVSIGGVVYAPELTSASTSNIIYYNTTSGAFTYSAAPTGGGDISWENEDDGLAGSMVYAVGDGSISTDTSIYIGTNSGLSAIYTSPAPAGLRIYTPGTAGTSGEIQIATSNGGTGSGDITIQTGTGTAPGDINIQSTGGLFLGDNSIYIGTTDAAGTNGIIWNPTNQLLAVDGSITATNEITAYASDRRLKTNITNIPDALEKLHKINGVTYNWNDNVRDLGFNPNAELEVGVIAQEIGDLFPDAIAAAPFDTDPHTGKSISGENYITVKHHKIIPLLIEAVKELSQKVKDLEDQINNS